MRLEDRLKQLIIDRYKSILEFSRVTNISYSTIDSILKRGVTNSSVTNVIRICQHLDISVDALANGQIVPLNWFRIPENISLEMRELFNEVKIALRNGENLTIDGVPISREDAETIITALDIGLDMAKRGKRHN